MNKIMQKLDMAVIGAKAKLIEKREGYGVYIDAVREWHQATFFYESMWNMVLFFVLLFIGRKARKDGTLLAVYFMGYGLGRFLIEGLRTDSLYLVGNIRVSQMLSLVLIFVGMMLLTLLKRNKIKNRVYHGKYSN